MSQYWVRRSDQSGRWHRVEVEVADRVWTKCGKQMEAIDKRGYDFDWLFTDPGSFAACVRCASVVPSVSPGA